MKTTRETDRKNVFLNQLVDDDNVKITILGEVVHCRAGDIIISIETCLNECPCFLKLTHTFVCKTCVRQFQVESNTNDIKCPKCEEKGLTASSEIEIVKKEITCLPPTITTSVVKNIGSKEFNFNNGI